MAVRCVTRISGTTSFVLQRGERSSGVLSVGRQPWLRANEQPHWPGKPPVGEKLGEGKADSRDAHDPMSLGPDSPVDRSSYTAATQGLSQCLPEWTAAVISLVRTSVSSSSDEA